MRRLLRATAACTALAFASGCGVSSWVTAPESKYPISMSSGIRDQDGRLVPAGRKTVVGEYKQSYKACSMLWRLISFTGDKDISEQVNEQVASAKGDAIVDLSVESSATVWTLMTFIGIFPDCGQVRLKGSIVKVVPAATPAKPTPSPVAATLPAKPPSAEPNPAVLPEPAVATPPP